MESLAPYSCIYLQHELAVLRVHHEHPFRVRVVGVADDLAQTIPAVSPVVRVGDVAGIWGLDGTNFSVLQKQIVNMFNKWSWLGGVICMCKQATKCNNST